MIYLDHHAATPVLDEAREAMARAHAEAWGNPSSVHAAGRAAKGVLERARQQVARAIGAQPADVVLTGGGTEACNLAVLGLFPQDAHSDAHVITSALEHPAVGQALASLAARGAHVECLSAERGVPWTANELARRITERTKLVAIQWVNHETGTLLPVADYAAVCSERGVPFVVDASQALARLPVNVAELGATALIVSSAKVGGPQGAAALFVERCRELFPVLYGGAQERGRRPGTPDVSAIAGFGAAAACVERRLQAMPQVAARRDRLEEACVALGGVVNGGEGPRVASVTNLSFRGWRGDILVAALDVEGLCASSGAACSSGLGAPSPVLLAMYPDEPWRAESALRLSLGPETTDEQIEQAIAVLKRVLGRTQHS